MYPRRFRPGKRPAPNNSIDEGHQYAGLGELPADWRQQAGPRPPILSPRGIPQSGDMTLGVPMGPAPPPPAQRSYNPQALSTYTVEIPAGIATPVFASTRERSYSLIINSGANAAVITYGRPPSGATDGIPLAAAGVGFHELLNGTTSTCTAFAAAATFLTITEGRYDPAMEL